MLSTQNRKSTFIAKITLTAMSGLSAAVQTLSPDEVQCCLIIARAQAAGSATTPHSRAFPMFVAFPNPDAIPMSHNNRFPFYCSEFVPSEGLLSFQGHQEAAAKAPDGKEKKGRRALRGASVRAEETQGFSNE